MEIPNRGKVLLYGESMIGVESAPVEAYEFSQLSALREYMLPIMRRYNGVGLAAPQIGVFKQYFIMEDENQNLVDYVNPYIDQMYGKEVEDFEACLSLPPSGNGCEVPRMEHIHVTASNSENPYERKTVTLSYMNARVAQHEIDHLCGVFFIDRVPDKKRSQVLKSFTSWKMNQNLMEEQCKKRFQTTLHSSPIR